ncbi:MAG: type II toxin-antitoxin system VapC family toxin [Burkholderiales bacterium]|nr:type II toxin-antitoxin system VapC family toxin [Burkholderiales bacterium]
MIAIDTSVLIDLIGAGPGADAAETTLRTALAEGPVVACEVVVSEVVAGLGSGAVVMEVLDEVGIGFVPLEMRSAVRAGEMQRRYKERLRAGHALAAGARTVPDFLIGAHALLQCGALITRDAVFFRDYFKGLKVIVPKA